jgi:hypothetical protein
MKLKLKLKQILIFHKLSEIKTNINQKIRDKIKKQKEIKGLILKLQGREQKSRERGKSNKKKRQPKSNRISVFYTSCLYLKETSRQI